MVVIVAAYTLFVTSPPDVTFTFANKRFGELLYKHSPYSLLYNVSL